MVNRPVSRTPYRGVTGTKGQALDLLRALGADARYQTLGDGPARALDRALIERADAEGGWHVRLGAWGRLCGGKSADTMGRYVRAMRQVGLVSVTPYVRPPGARTPGQGASIYRLDPSIVAAARSVSTSPVESDAPCGDGESDGATRGVKADGATRGARFDGPERLLNEKKNGPRPAAPVGARGPALIETCESCGTEGACWDFPAEGFFVTGHVLCRACGAPASKAGGV